MDDKVLAMFLVYIQISDCNSTYLGMNLRMTKLTVINLAVVVYIGKDFDKPADYKQTEVDQIIFYVFMLLNIPLSFFLHRIKAEDEQNNDEEQSYRMSI